MLRIHIITIIANAYNLSIIMLHEFDTHKKCVSFLKRNVNVDKKIII